MINIKSILLILRTKSWFEIYIFVKICFFTASLWLVCEKLNLSLRKKRRNKEIFKISIWKCFDHLRKCPKTDCKGWLGGTLWSKGMIMSGREERELQTLSWYFGHWSRTCRHWQEMATILQLCFSISKPWILSEIREFHNESKSCRDNMEEFIVNLAIIFVAIFYGK